MQREEVSKKNHVNFYLDNIVYNYYLEKIKSVNSRELDSEFNNLFKTLVKCLVKADNKQKTYFIDLLARLIEFYIENRIEKEINSSFSKLLK